MAAKLVVKSAVETLEVPLELGKEYFIGRSHEANVLVRDPQVSRRHCQIAAGPDRQWTLTDLGSGNGTFLGKTRVTRHQFRHGDVVRVGKSSVQFLQDEAERAAAASQAARPLEPAVEDIPVLSPADTPAPRPASPLPPGEGRVRDVAPVAPPPNAQSPGLPSPGLAAGASAFPTPFGEAQAAAAPAPATAPPVPAPWRRWAKRLSPAAFAIAVLAFFLPFEHQFRDGDRTRSPIGFDLAFGSSASNGDLDPPVLFVLIAAAAGLGLSFLTTERSAVAPAMAALAACGLFVWEFFRIRAGGEGAIAAGMGLALGLFLATAGLNAFLFFTRKKGAG